MAQALTDSGHEDVSVYWGEWYRGGKKRLPIPEWYQGFLRQIANRPIVKEDMISSEEALRRLEGVKTRGK